MVIICFYVSVRKSIFFWYGFKAKNIFFINPCLYVGNCNKMKRPPLAAFPYFLNNKIR